MRVRLFVNVCVCVCLWLLCVTPASVDFENVQVSLAVVKSVFTWLYCWLSLRSCSREYVHSAGRSSSYAKCLLVRSYVTYLFFVSLSAFRHPVVIWSSSSFQHYCMVSSCDVDFAAFVVCNHFYVVTSVDIDRYVFCVNIWAFDRLVSVAPIYTIFFFTNRRCRLHGPPFADNIAGPLPSYDVSTAKFHPRARCRRKPVFDLCFVCSQGKTFSSFQLKRFRDDSATCVRQFGNVWSLSISSWRDQIVIVLILHCAFSVNSNFIGVK